MKAVIYRPVMDDIEVDVTPEDLDRGCVEFECGACKGTGVAFWHPGYPDDEGPGCIECSTTGVKEATL